MSPDPCISDTIKVKSFIKFHKFEYGLSAKHRLKGFQQYYTED